MINGRLIKGEKFIMNGREYEVARTLPNGDIQLHDMVSNDYFAKPRMELIDALFEGNLNLVVEGNGKYVRRKAADMLSVEFAHLPEDDKKTAKRKYAYVMAYDNVKLNRKTEKCIQPLLDAIRKEIGDEKEAPSAITLYRWWRDFRASGEDIRSLLPHKKEKGNGKDRLVKEIRDIIDAAISERYLNEQKNSELSVYDLVVARIGHENKLRDPSDKLKIPSHMAIYRHIDKLDPYEVMKARYGKRIADQTFDAKGMGVRPTRPLERVEIDHTKLDLFAIDLQRNMPIGRPWLTMAIDVATKLPLGFYVSFNPPSYLSVMHCMRHAIKPKSYVRKAYPEIVNSWDAYGIFETAVVDNGKEFHSLDLEDACLQIGTVIQYAPIKLGSYKPSVERYFRTLNTQLLHRQPGTTFSNIFEKGEYDPVKNAVIDFETLIKIIHMWIIDVYSQNFHRGIRAIPAKLWAKAVEEYSPAVPRNKNELDALLGMVEYRVISAQGIELNGLFYNNDALAVLRRRWMTDEGYRSEEGKVKVKFDPSDLGVIHVYDKETMSFVPVEASAYSYAEGLTLWQHRVIRRHAQKEFGKDDIVTLAMAKERIQQLVESAMKHGKRKGTHQKAARWLNISQDRLGHIVEEGNDSDEG